MMIGPAMKISTSLALALAGIGGIVKVTAWATDFRRDITAGQEAVHREISEVKSSVQAVSNSMWTRNDHVRWSYELERSNRELHIIVPMASGETGIITGPR